MQVWEGDVVEGWVELRGFGKMFVFTRFGKSGWGENGSKLKPEKREESGDVGQREKKNNV